MSESRQILVNTADQKDFLYSVLNLPASASDHEIRERYKSLSIVFHPDKHHGRDSSKVTAEKRFLEIQKAYEVLSDPFLREVYNIFGNEGLTSQWPTDLRSKPPEELRKILLHTKAILHQQKLEDMVRPRGVLTIGVDAAPLFGEEDEFPEDREPLWDRLCRVKLLTTSLSHQITHTVNEKIRLRLAARVQTNLTPPRDIIAGSSGISGAIRYQFSPRWSFQSSTAFLHPRRLDLKTIYRDDDTAFTIRTRFSPRILSLFPPPVTLSVTRRLFRTSPMQGIFTVHSGGSEPSLSISILSPSPFDLSERPAPPPASNSGTHLHTLGSPSGLSTGSTYSSYGIVLAGLNTGFNAEWGLKFSEIAVQVKLGLEYLLISGLGISFTGAWSRGRNEIATSVGLSQLGVVLKIEFAFLGQHASIPVVLSHEYAPALAMWTAVVPSTALILGYHFVLKPRRRAQRAAYFVAARRMMEDDKLQVRREFEETAAMLKETARKHMQAEGSKGLIILDATYGPTDPDENARELVLDATVAVQALVHNSQVYIPGNRTKSGIQGFYDPAPECPKMLRVRYDFRGRTHYAEIPDHVPVVLPLADHLVEKSTAGDLE